MALRRNHPREHGIPANCGEHLLSNVSMHVTVLLHARHDAVAGSSYWHDQASFESFGLAKHLCWLQQLTCLVFKFQSYLCACLGQYV